MGKIANFGVHRGNPAAAVHRAFADIASRIHAQAQEHGRAARPLLEQVAREVATGEHRRHQVRRLGNAAFTTAA